ncbi:hypothetical protein SH2C18_05680 [Clostridium sediminicola]|uniref:transglycosylase domain-containing protein n=1 Tax=Clostridium sediminicola TaxID=3114879 RepID=UPI0031F21E61
MSQNKKSQKKEKKPKKKRFMALKLILLSILIAFLFGCTVFAGIGLAMIRSAPDLDMSEIITYDEPSKIYDDQGQFMDEVNTEKKRTVIDINDMSDYVKKAVVSVEDERFYTHQGIDLRRIFGVIYYDIRDYLSGSNSNPAGGSTLTQQLLVNTIFERGTTLTEKIQRKFQEIYLALQLENEISKDDILEAYMNTFYLGGKAIGVEAAANQYFDKSAKELDMLESAFIAGLTQSPSRYYPYSITSRFGVYPIDTDTEEVPKYIKRTRTVLYTMKKNQVISEEEYDKAIEEVNSSPITANLYKMYLDGIISKDFYGAGLKENNIESENVASNLLLLYNKGYITKDFYDANVKKLYKTEAIEYLNTRLQVATEAKDEAAIARITNSIGKLKEESSYLAEINSDINGGDFLTNESPNYEYSSLVSSLDFQAALGSKLILSPTGTSEKYNFEWFSRPVVNSVKSDLKEKYNLSDDEVDNMIINGNLKIYSTMDRNLQNETQKILDADDYYRYLNVSPKPGPDGTLQPQASAVVVDYHLGEVKTIIGAKYDQPANSLNRATDAYVPSGSSIKPLSVYAPAIDTKVLTSGSVIEDSPLEPALSKKYKGWNPKNSPNKYYGYVTMKEALKKSINVVAVKILDKVGVSKGAEYAEKFGLTFKNPNEKAFSSSVALGQFTGTNTFTMANAYGVFGNEGMYTEPRLYTKVVNRQGKVILETKVETREVITPQTAFIMHDMLYGPTHGGTGNRINLTYKSTLPTIVGKTGSATDFKNLWFCGLTPYYSGAVWLDNPFKWKIYSSDAAYVFGKIMAVANNGKEPKKIPRPDGVVYAKVDIDSGLLPTELSYIDPRGNRVKGFYYISGTVPNEKDNVHVEAEVNSQNGLLATENTPDEFREKRVFITRDYDPTVNLIDQQYVLPTEIDDTLPPAPEVPEEPGDDTDTPENPGDSNNTDGTDTPTDLPSDNTDPND